MAAYQNGDYATALELSRPLADQGDARAQSILGLIYYGGRGVPRNDNEAVRWFRHAADLGDATGNLYLGVMFADGRGVPQDYAEAAKWYRLAADLGDAQAQYNLGLAYAKGEGVSPDNVSAHMWFNLAAARFPASDLRSRDAAVRNRDLVAGNMTPEQLAEAQAGARLEAEMTGVAPDGAAACGAMRHLINLDGIDRPALDLRAQVGVEAGIAGGEDLQRGEHGVGGLEHGHDRYLAGRPQGRPRPPRETP